MKKLLVTALAFAMMFQYGWAQADALKNFAYDGQIDVQATSANNINDFNTATYDQIGDVQTRIMLNMGWDLLDDVHAKVGVFKNDSVYGKADAALASSGGNNQSIGTTTGGGVLGDTLVDQANIKIDKLFGFADTTLGRQFYGDPGDIIAYFGPYSNLYGMPVNALDMVRFDWANDMVGVTGIVGKTTGNALAAGNDAGAVDLRGLTATVKNLTNATAGAYLYNQVDHESVATAVPSANDNLWIAGLKGKYTMGGAWVRGEFAKNFGENRDASAMNGQKAGAGIGNSNYAGWAIKADAGYKADLAPASVTPWAQLAIGSGGSTSANTFAAINPDYRPGGIYGRFAAITGNPTTSQLGNGITGNNGTFDNGSLADLVNWGLGVKATPASLSKLTAGISYWDYRFQSAASIAGDGASGNTHIGSEVDLNLDWAHSQNVSVDAGIGSFQPGGFIANSDKAVGNNPAFLASFDVHVKF